MKAITGVFAKVKRFLKETRAEMRKVVWPPKRYVAVATFIVLVIVAVLGGFVMLLDTVLSKFFMYLFKAF